MPTPEPVTSAPLAADASTTTEPEPRYLFGGVALPTTTPDTGADLLALCDPWLSEALPYFKHCINRALAAPFRAAMAGQALATDSACVETLPVDPAAYLHSRALRLPLLCGYPITATFAEHTFQRERAVIPYRFDYILPALSHEQAARIVPMLSAVVAVLVRAIRLAGSASYQSDRDVWGEGGSAQVKPISVTFGTFERADLAVPLPALSLLVEVTLLSRDDEDAGLPLWGSSLTVDTDSDDGDPLTLTEARTDLP